MWEKIVASCWIDIFPSWYLLCHGRNSLPTFLSHHFLRIKCIHTALLPFNQQECSSKVVYGNIIFHLHLRPQLACHWPGMIYIQKWWPLAAKIDHWSLEIYVTAHKVIKYAQACSYNTSTIHNSCFNWNDHVNIFLKVSMF